MKTYMGRKIFSCAMVESRRQGYRWYVEVLAGRDGNLSMAEEASPRFPSLGLAKQYIRDTAR